LRIMVRIETLVSCMMDACCKPIHQQYLLGKYHYEELAASLHDACSTPNSVYRDSGMRFLDREKRRLFLLRAGLHPSTAYRYASTLD